MTNIARIGVRVFRNRRGDKNPLISYRSEIYDLDSGVLLPVESADIHLDCNSFVTATVTVAVSDVEIVEAD